MGIGLTGLGAGGATIRFGRGTDRKGNRLGNLQPRLLKYELVKQEAEIILIKRVVGFEVRFVSKDRLEDV